MKIKESIPWICILVLSLSVAVFTLDLLTAYRSFGHVPQYLVDTDPFHAEVTWLLPVGVLILYLLSPIILIISALLVLNPWTRYKGKYTLLFYLITISIGILHYLLLWQDVTGFVTWSID